MGGGAHAWALTFQTSPSHGSVKLGPHRIPTTGSDCLDLPELSGALVISESWERRVTTVLNALGVGFESLRAHRCDDPGRGSRLSRNLVNWDGPGERLGSLSFCSTGWRTGCAELTHHPPPLTSRRALCIASPPC